MQRDVGGDGENDDCEHARKHGADASKNASWTMSFAQVSLDPFSINRYLRGMLVEVSWLGLRTNPWMKQVFDRVCRGCPSRRKIAIVAVARRLLIWCWAMLRDDREWNPKALAAA